MAEDASFWASEPSLLEYARFHGIAIDHLAFGEHFEEITGPHTCPGLDIEDPLGAQVLTLGPAPTKETIQCPKEVAKLLASVIKPPEPDALWESLLPTYRKTTNPNVELPLLKSGHDEDMRRFGIREEPIDTMYNLLLISIDEKKDEGFSWPSWYLKYPKKCMNDVLGEKLGVPKNAWLYLQNTMRSQVKVEDMNAVLDQRIKYEKKGRFEAMTPLLLASEPNPTLFVPSSSTCEFELLSKRTSPLIEEHDKTEEAIKEKKLELPDAWKQTLSQDDMLLDFLNFEGAPFDKLVDLPNTPTKRPKMSDLKVEILMTPLASAPTVTGQDVDGLLDELKEGFVPEASPKYGEVGANEHLYQMDKHASDQLEERLKQEQTNLQAVKLRVNVPQIDFTLPTPPWTTTCNESQQNITTTGRLEALGLMGTRQFDSKGYFWSFDPLKERKLRWRFFPPEQGRVNIRETFEGSNYPARILNDIRISDSVAFDTLLPRREPFTLLNALGSEEDDPLFLDKTTIPLTNPVQSQQHFSSTEIKMPPSLNLPIQPAFKSQRFSNIAVEPIIGHKRPPSSNPSPQSFFLGHVDIDKYLPSSSLSSVDPLSDFLRGRGRSPKRLRITAKESSFSSKKLVNDTPFQPILQGQTTNPASTPQAHESTTKDTVRHLSLPLPTHPITLIVPLAIEKNHRDRMISLRTHFPSIEIIERDYIHSKIHPHNNEVLVNNSNLPEWEADVVLSPSTAIILTTMTLLSQTALPGHRPSPSALRARIAHLSIRYERIYILITTRSVPSSLDVSACVALTSLSVFCISLAATSTISPVVVPSLTTNVLQRYILSLAAKHCLNLPAVGTGITMLAEETTWELFLRAAGLNTYAAQVLVNMVKKLDGETYEGMDVASSNRSRYWGSSSVGSMGVEGGRRLLGLQAILQMTVMEREEKFREIMGGVRVLERVSKRLDAMWG